MSVSLEQFVQHLTASGLMSAGEVTSFQQSLPSQRQPKDAETLARELIQANKLTKYQAQVVYQGKTKGLVFGDYRVLDKLGQGGMGVVLKAEHRRMKRLVAVKMIAGAAMKSSDAVKRFYREVEAAARLIHTNIVAAFDAAEHDGVHYLMMEYIEGKDLAAIVKERGPLPVAQAVDCTIQAARGLQYAHEQGIIHRDIKPGNLLVDKKGTVKILDMGLARVAGVAEDPNAEKLTQSGQVMGSVDYMAPEQAMDTHTADARADIYSLGCTLYRLLTAEAPYKGESLAKILIGHQLSPIPSLCRARSDVPPQLDAIYQKMVAKRPEDRQQSMTEVIADLESCTGKRIGAAQALAEQANNDDALQDALSFLKDTSGPKAATLGKKKAQAVEQTLNQPPTSETSRQVDLPQKLTGQKKLLGAAIAGAVVVAGIVVCAVIVTIRHPDGKKTAVSVPEGSQVTVSKRGNLEVTVTPEEVVPAVKGGFNPELAAQSPLFSKQVSYIGPDGQWKLPPGAPQPAIAPFAFIKEVAALPAEEQVKRVVAKLRELNPGYDGWEKHEIRNGKVTALEFKSDDVRQITPIRALASLEKLICPSSKQTKRARISDLSPLKGLRLTVLNIYRTEVHDLSPLSGMPLTNIHCNYCPITDLTPLRGMPLEELNCDRNKISDLSPLAGAPLSHLLCYATEVSDLSPLKGMPLRRLGIWSTKIHDLSPLQGMAVDDLRISDTAVQDLSPLRGTPLRVFQCQATKVTDLSPLKDTPLEFLTCDFDPKRDTEILRSIKTLKKINGLPVAEFWKEVETGKIPPPTPDVAVGL